KGDVGAGGLAQRDREGGRLAGLRGDDSVRGGDDEERRVGRGGRLGGERERRRTVRKGGGEVGRVVDEPDLGRLQLRGGPVPVAVAHDGDGAADDQGAGHVDDQVGVRVEGERSRAGVELVVI